MRSVVLASAICVWGCGDGGSAPYLEPGVTLPNVAADFKLEFDTENNAVVTLMTSGLSRQSGDTFVPIPAAATTVVSAFGFDTDGALLVASFAPGTADHGVKRLALDNTLVQLGGQVPSTAMLLAPVQTPAGNRFVRIGTTSSFQLATGASMWTSSTTVLQSHARAPDGTLYAIVAGNVVRFEANDVQTAIVACSALGASCGTSLQLVGVDKDGRLYFSRTSGNDVQIVEPGGDIRRVTLPPGHSTIAARAGASFTIVRARALGREVIDILSAGGVAFGTVYEGSEPLDATGAGIHVDQAGKVYLSHEGKLQTVVIPE